MTGIITAALVVGGVGLLIGIFLGVAGEKFKVVTDERENRVEENFRVITVVDADIPDVMVLRQLL